MIEAHVFSYGQRHFYADEWAQWLGLRRRRESPRLTDEGQVELTQ